MTGSTIRSAVVRAGKLVIESCPRPEPAVGEARVRLRACGICGTDLHFHRNGFWPDGRVPGHEMFGEVDSLGDGVRDLAVGEPVAIEPIAARAVPASTRLLSPLRNRRATRQLKLQPEGLTLNA